MSEYRSLTRDQSPAGQVLLKEKELGKSNNSYPRTTATWALLAGAILVGSVAAVGSLAIALAGLVVWARDPELMTWLSPLISLMLVSLSAGFFFFMVEGFRARDSVYQLISIILAVVLWPATLLGGFLLSAFVAGS